MEMQFKNEIKKLADVVVWFDNWIEETKLDLTEEEMEDDETIKEFETIKKVILESIERHNVYTSALNNDIADKAAKIELLEKEIEGRKEGYTALKELMDTKYISIDEHNKIVDQFKEEIKKLNKCIMNKNESINTGNEAIINLRKQIGAHEDENKKLENRISELKTEVNKLNRFLKMQEDLTRDWKNKYVEAQKEIDELESDSSEYETIIQYQELIDGLNKDLSYWKEAFETQATSLADVRKLNNELVDTLDKSNDEIEKLEKQVKYLEKELEETCRTKELDLKNHQKRDMALVDELAKKNDEIKKLKESIEEWKNQERIRTNQLRATERKVEELWKEIEKFTKGEDDDHGKSGFKRYIEHLIEEEERAVPERFKERLNEEITAIFTKEEETAKELAKKRLNKKFGIGGIVDEFKDDIPCGEDAIE